MANPVDNSIDKELFGMLVRRHRLNLGYRKAEDFVAVMWEVAKYSISRDGLYRIETGKVVPNIDFIIAFNIMLGKPALDSSIVDMCLPKNWRDLASEEEERTYDRYEYVLKDAPF